MPTYVYGCDTCGHGFEQIQKFQDAALVTCPECGARIRRIFQPAGIVFKGTGWYSTDSRAERAGNGNGAKKEKAESGDGRSPGHGSPKGGIAGGKSATPSSVT